MTKYNNYHSKIIIIWYKIKIKTLIINIFYLLIILLNNFINYDNGMILKSGIKIIWKINLC